MAESDSLAYDHDINSQFIIIQSCLKDESHNELIQNSKDITLLEDNLTFNLGDSFECFESLTSRLEAHSKQSNVYYWLRDSRTISGARSKTSRKINSTLKYVNLNYVCVYGGKPINPRGEGKRKRMSMRLNCPAHIKLRVNRAGIRLDVMSVCNHHNHPIDPHIYSHLPQGRRLPSDLKPDVYDMLRMGVVKRRVLDYVRWRCGKVLTLKDLINIAATLKNSDGPSQQRRKCLLEALRKLELENGKSTPQCKTEKAASDTKKGRRRPPEKCKANDIIIKTEDINEGATRELAMLVIEPAAEVTLEAEDGSDDSMTEHTEYQLLPMDVDRVVEIHYEDEENHDSITHSSIMKYLYKTDCDGEQVIAILNDDHEMVTLEPNVLSEQCFIPAEELCEQQGVELCEDQGELCEDQCVELCEDQDKELREDQGELCEDQCVELCEDQDKELREDQGELCEDQCVELCEDHDKELRENQGELCEDQGVELGENHGVTVCEDQDKELRENQGELCEDHGVELGENHGVTVCEDQDKELRENQGELCEDQGVELGENHGVTVCEDQDKELRENQGELCEDQGVELGENHGVTVCEDQDKELCEDQGELCEDQCVELCEDQGVELGENQSVKVCEDQDKELCEDQGVELGENQGIKVCEDQDKELCEEQGKELCDVKNLVQNLKKSPMYMAEDQHFMPEDPQIWSNSEVILEETWISSNNVTNADEEIHCDNIMFNVNNCDIEQVIDGSSQIVQLVEECNNCEKIKADLNMDVNRLRKEKMQLIEETERLRRTKKRLEQQLKSLKMRL